MKHKPRSNTPIAPARGKYSREKAGLARLRAIHGDYGPAVLGKLDGIAPDLKKWIIEFGFGEVYSRPGLDLRARQITTITALVALGHAGDELQAHIRAGLKAGLARREVVEIIMQLALYAGFPAAIRGIMAAQRTFAELDGNRG